MSSSSKARYALESIDGRAPPKPHQASGRTPMKAAEKIAGAVFRGKEVPGGAARVRLVIRRMQREGAEKDKPRFAYVAQWVKNPKGPKTMDFGGVKKTVGEFVAVLSVASKAAMAGGSEGATLDPSTLPAVLGPTTDPAAAQGWALPAGGAGPTAGTPPASILGHENTAFTQGLTNRALNPGPLS